jgi:hypothetical protein
MAIVSRVRSSVKMQQGEHRQDWESWVEQQIREAQGRGAFDNLPGRGQSLALTPNPYAKEQEMAFKILKDAGFAPEWIELGKVIRTRLESAHKERTAQAFRLVTTRHEHALRSPRMKQDFQHVSGRCSSQAKQIGSVPDVQE